MESFQRKTTNVKIIKVEENIDTNLYMDDGNQVLNQLNPVLHSLQHRQSFDFDL